MWKKGRSVLAEALRPKPPSVPNGAQNSVPSLRSIGTASNQAAPGTIGANDFLVKTTSTTLSAERVVTDTASVVWDWSTAGQAKASAVVAGVSPLTSKGDLWGYSTVNARIPVGADGKVLTADSSAALGVAWAMPAVTSVFGRTGAVVAMNGDYTAAMVGAVPTTRNVNTTAPLTGGGALSSDLTLAIPAASGAANGYLSSADWTTFNNKASAVVTTKGDLYTYSTVAARLGVGSDGQVLTADSTAATGLKWAASSSGITQLTGDVTAGPGSGSQAATIAADAVDNTKLANMANQTVKARNTAGTGDPEDSTLSTILDWLSSTRGALLTRGAATWGALALGSDGQAVRVSGSDPAYSTIAPAIFGDGSDGALTYDGSSTVLGMAPVSNVYTLTRDIFATNLTLNSGISIKTAGYRIYCTGTLAFADNTSIIHWNGNAASGATGGAFLSGGPVGANGGAGGANGRSTTGAGASAGSLSTTYVGNGAAGGTAGGANTGGLGTTATAPAATLGSYREVGFIFRNHRLIMAGSQGASQALGMGTAGGAGGCDVSGGGTATSGGGGGGAGIVAVVARLITGAGVFQAKGGVGAAAVSTGAGKAGGGGGGSGCMVDVTMQSTTQSFTIDVAGGAGGAGANGGASGGTGTAGYSIVRTI